MRNLKMTRHNGRAGKHGVYNPKHNDRQFDLTNADHIDAVRERQNIYWDCFQGFRTGMDDGQAHDSFEDVERQFYSIFYRESVEAQNERNIQNRHPERNRSTDDLLHDKRTCPEESILQIGNIDESVDGETLVKIACAFFTEMEERFGEHIHFLDWSLHMGEGTPHIHERHVFDADDGYGHAKPQQEKALEALGIELPDPSKKPGKNNNRKMTFDKICRDLFMEICERHDLYVDRDPTYGGRTYLEKQEYIIMAQKQRLEELEAELEAKTLKIQDVDAIVEEVSEAAYHMLGKPDPKATTEINSIMNNTIKGWKQGKQHRYPQYGQQRSWERVNEPDPLDGGWTDLSDVPCEQLGIPEEWLKPPNEG